jgi:hypothetical protein
MTERVYVFHKLGIRTFQWRTHVAPMSNAPTSCKPGRDYWCFDLPHAPQVPAKGPSGGSITTAWKARTNQTRAMTITTERHLVVWSDRAET